MYLTKYLVFFELDSSTVLLVNSLSGSVDKTSHDLASKLKRVHQKKTSEIDFEMESSIETHLKERGYLFETREDEENSLLALYEKSKEIYAQNPVKFVICPTYSCNLRCTYCFEGDFVAKNKTVLNKEQLSSILSAVDEIRERQSISRWVFELFGGEPLLRSTKPIVEEIFHELHNRGDILAIITNGTNILEFKEMIQEYQDILDSIQVTLDGPKTIHDKRRKHTNGKGTFDEIVRGIDFLLDAGISARVRVNIDRENIYYLPEFVAFMERKTWPSHRNFHCDIVPVNSHTSRVHSPHILREDEAVRIILDMFPDIATLRKTFNFTMFRVLTYISSILEPARQHVAVTPAFHYCEANSLEYYVFGPDNGLYACPDTIINKEYAIGTYFPELNIDEEKRSSWKRDILSIPKCRECEVATFCGGGCALAPRERGEMNPDCNGAKEALFAYLTWWKKTSCQGQ